MTMHRCMICISGDIVLCVDELCHIRNTLQQDRVSLQEPCAVQDVVQRVAALVIQPLHVSLA